MQRLSYSYLPQRSGVARAPGRPLEENRNGRPRAVPLHSDHAGQDHQLLSADGALLQMKPDQLPTVKAVVPIDKSVNILRRQLRALAAVYFLVVGIGNAAKKPNNSRVDHDKYPSICCMGVSNLTAPAPAGPSQRRPESRPRQTPAPPDCALVYSGHRGAFYTPRCGLC